MFALPGFCRDTVNGIMFLHELKPARMHRDIKVCAAFASAPGSAAACAFAPEFADVSRAFNGETSLSLDQADGMIKNLVTSFTLPVGIATSFLVTGFSSNDG